MSELFHLVTNLSLLIGMALLAAGITLLIMSKGDDGLGLLISGVLLLGLTFGGRHEATNMVNQIERERQTKLTALKTRPEAPLVCRTVHVFSADEEWIVNTWKLKKGDGNRTLVYDLDHDRVWDLDVCDLSSSENGGVR